MDEDQELELREALERDDTNREAQRELLTVLYWFTAGLPAKVPPEVKAHPLWPENNDVFHKESTRGHLGTSYPGRDRLWEAIEQEFGLDLRGKRK